MKDEEPEWTGGNEGRTKKSLGVKGNHLLSNGTDKKF